MYVKFLNCVCCLTVWEVGVGRLSPDLEVCGEGSPTVFT